MTFELILYLIYSICGLGLFIYGVNAYLNVFFYLKHSKKKWASTEIQDETDWPNVLTQLPLYNEQNVIERLLEKVTAIDYPKDKHFIQVLDDSTDGSELLSKKWVEHYQSLGFKIEWVYRSNRVDYKAGALREGLEKIKDQNVEYVAVLDADFVPNPDFLKKGVWGLLQNENWAFAQGRWGHINSEYSLLTLAQSVGIDGHFVVEQSARAWNGFFMNFNGSGGIWRIKAIEEAGNWQGDTLTEDLDLSYRSQLKGWSCGFLPDLEVPAEIPEDINAFKQQQYRWAKGSIQTALKIFPLVLKSDKGFVVKWQALIHLTHYLIHPLMLISAILSVPLLVFYPQSPNFSWLGLVLIPIILSTVAPSFLYLVAQKKLYPQKWAKRLSIMPLLAGFGVGLAVNNTKAVLSALAKRESGFVRTPKKGDKTIKFYKLKFPFIAFIELLVGGFCIAGLYFVLQAQREAQILVTPFLWLYGTGFLTVGFLSLGHHRKQNKELKAFELASGVERS